MLLVWSESRTREALDQVIAIRDELSRNVLAAVSMVPSNDAITYPHLARVVHVTLNKEPPPVAGGFIAVNGTKGNINSAAGEGAAGIVDAAALLRGCIARDGAVGEGERAAAIEDAAAATWSRYRIARDDAVGEGERAVAIEDAAAFAVLSRYRIVRDSAVGEGERTLIVDAAAVAA